MKNNVQYDKLNVSDPTKIETIRYLVFNHEREVILSQVAFILGMV